MLHKSLLIFIVSLFVMTSCAQENQPITVTHLSELLGEFATENGMKSAVISPDGTMIAWNEKVDDGTNICLYMLQSKQANCHTDSREIKLPSAGMRWSPDSKYIAFTEKMGIADPDIWVFDVITGQFKNHTDDDFVAFNPMVTSSIKEVMIENNVALDLLPMWNPINNNQLYFIRYAFDPNEDEIRTSLYLLDIDSSKLEEVYDLSTEIPANALQTEYQVLNGQVDLNSDGTRFALMTFGSKEGIWILDLAKGGSLTQIMSYPLKDIGLPQPIGRDLHANGLAWSTDGSTLFVSVWAIGDTGDNSNVYAVDIETNGVIPLVDYDEYSSSELDQLDDAGYPLLSHFPRNPVYLQDSILATGFGWTTDIKVLRRFTDLHNSVTSEVIYEFEERSGIALETMSVSNNGKAIIAGGYLIELPN